MTFPSASAASLPRIANEPLHKSRLCQGATLVVPCYKTAFFRSP
jgi:hypothetical protein